MEASQSGAFASELAAYCKHLNTHLACYEEIASYFPLSSDNLFERLRDGIVLGYLLNHYYPGSVRLANLVRGLDLEKMNQIHTKVTFEVNANLNLIVQAAKSVKSLVVVNLGAEDILNCNKDLVSGLLWQIFHAKFVNDISLLAHPELVRLAEGSETLASLAQLKSEALLTRWFNYHLRRAGHARRVSNFGADIADGELYAVLMRQIAPRLIGEDEVGKVLAMPALDAEQRLQRAEVLLGLAERLGCRDFVSPADIANGHPRLNFAFTATLFNRHIGITIPSEEDLSQMQEQKNQLMAESAEIKAKLQEAEFALVTFRQSFEQEMANVRVQLDQAEASKRQEMSEQADRFEQAKEELAMQYRDSLECALESERRLHQEEMWGLFNKQRENRRQLLAVGSILRSGIPTAELERAKLPASLDCEDYDMAFLLKSVGEMATLLCRRISALEADSEGLRSALAHKEKVNEVMGEKIREYTENVIHCKKGDTQQRGSLLKRIFHNDTK